MSYQLTSRPDETFSNFANYLCKERIVIFYLRVVQVESYKSLPLSQPYLPPPTTTPEYFLASKTLSVDVSFVLLQTGFYLDQWLCGITNIRESQSKVRVWSVFLRPDLWVNVVSQLETLWRTQKSFGEPVSRHCRSFRFLLEYIGTNAFMLLLSVLEIFIYKKI